jgi:acyl carrier protein
MQDGEMITIDEVVRFLEESSLMIPGRIEPNTALRALSDWDSMGMIMFINLVHKRTGIRFRVSDLTHCETPEAFLKLVHERARSRPEST